MPEPCSADVPRAHVDPITDPTIAMALFAAAIDIPMCHQILAVPLRSGRVGGVITIVDHHGDEDAVLDVAALIGRSCGQLATPVELLVASVRPSHGMDDDDLDRWFELDAVADEHGLWLLEWFILSERGGSLPRRHVGVESRW